MVPLPQINIFFPGPACAACAARSAFPPGSISAPIVSSIESGSENNACAGTSSCSASAPGQPFHCVEADHALFDAITRHAKVPVEIMNETVNSTAFAQACALRLVELVKKRSTNP